MSKTRVLVVDDHPFFRGGIIQWLNQQSSLACCGEADSCQSARKAAAELKPDLVLLDLRLPDGQGLDLIRDLCVSHPGLRILVLSEHDESVYAHRALQAGARGYLMKGEAAQTALEAIQAVLRGDIFVSRTVSARLLHSLFPDPASRTPDLAHLSERELQVFQLLGAGCGSHDIAKQLRISPKTVDTYRERLKDKLHLPDARALLLAALRWVERGRLDVS